MKRNLRQTARVQKKSGATNGVRAAGARRPARAVEALEGRLLFAAAYQQDAGADGLVVMEAEAFDFQVGQGGKNWTPYAGAAGASGGAMQATPNTGTLLDSGFLATSPRLDFAVNFARTGVHYVWARGLGATTNDDSLHVGLDGAAVATADRVQLASNNALAWSGVTMDGGAVATLNVATAGRHTINLWMREDGAVADKLLLTTSPGYVPTGAGPAPSARVTDGGPPTVTVGATDANAAEANRDPGMVTFVRAGADTSAPLTVRYTVGGTATNGADYASLGGTVTIPAGATAAAVNVLTVDDAAAEGPETVVFAVAADPAYAVGSAASATVTIADNDAAVPPPPPTSGQTPYGGTAWAVPGQVEAENFDNGGEGVAHHDTDAVNVTGSYRSTGVDVEPTTDAGGGYAVGHVAAGEWLEYTVTVAATGTYDVSARVAAAGGFGGTFHVEIDGTNATGPIPLAPTGGWQSYATVTKAGVPVAAGTHVVRVAFDQANSGGDIGNLNWLKFASATVSPPTVPPPPPPPPPPTSPPPTPAPTSPFAWTAIAASPVARGEGQSTVVNGKLYAFGGFVNGAFQATTRSDVYDPAKNAWTQIAAMPEALTHAATLAVGSTVWMVGGFVGNHPGPETAHVWKYETTTNTWSAGPSLPAGRGGGAAAVVGSNLYFFGGLVRDPVTFAPTADCADAWSLNLNGGTSWSTLASMPNARNHLAGAAVNGLVYAVGGQHFEDEYAGNLAEVDVYNPATNAWSRVADLPVARGHTNPSTFVRNGRIVVVGGTKNGDVAMTDVTEYDPATNVWVGLQSLPEGRKSPVTGLIGDYLYVVGGDNPNPTATGWSGPISRTWSTSTSLPISLGEVAGGIVNGKMYVVGEGGSATLAYNLSTKAWASNLAVRPFVGNHHAAEVVNGKLYLIGGLGGSSEGKVQVYNPATNSWSTGASMPYAGGSVNSAVINGEIYVAGGIVGSSTTNQAAKYNPSTNAWTTLAAMPQGVNHAAASTDGKKLWVFGGRDGGNVPSNGFNYVQAYDPATNTWQSSGSGANLAPLPQARGGTGRAVFANGEFYVMGGETSTGPGATAKNVYNRVDVYNPSTNSWRLASPMPTARHGIFPLWFAGRVYVPGGGTQAGNSSSTLLEVYDLG